MDSNSRNSLPPSSTVKAPFDPGWNDPPSFSYTAQQTTPNRPRNFLNKRVAFPLSGSGTGQVQGPLPPVNLPPMPVAGVSLPISNTSSTPMKEFITIDSKAILKEVIETLNKILEETVELEPKSNDIKKRFRAMEDMWSTGKLNDRIQLQMKDLAFALKCDDPAKADEIHRALMVDHVNAVGTWMPGVKQLILNSIARNELLSIDKE